jgi:hypothetical protein
MVGEIGTGNFWRRHCADSPLVRRCIVTDVREYLLGPSYFYHHRHIKQSKS